jgi:hypothetical protein
MNIAAKDLQAQKLADHTHTASYEIGGETLTFRAVNERTALKYLKAELVRRGHTITDSV